MSQTRLTLTYTSSIIKTLFFVLIITLFTSTNAFSQENTATKEDISIVSKSDNASITSKAELMEWFMSTKQSHSFEANDIDTKLKKKNFLIKGTTPCKILYRTFVKKIANRDSALV